MLLPGNLLEQGAIVRLEGIHHIRAITGNAPRNVDDYTRVLGPPDPRADGAADRTATPVGATADPR
jgi:hypothetical protein